MPARNSRSNTAGESGNALLAPFTALADLPRRQMALMAQSASAVLRGSEAVRKFQQQSAQRALAQHEEAAERLRGEVDFNELLTIQAELLRFNLQEAAQYWQQLTNTALEVQAEMVSSAGDAMEEGGEPTLHSLQRAFQASLNGGATRATAH